MISAEKAIASIDSRLIEESVRSSLVSLQQMLGRGTLHVKAQEFIDSSAAASQCLRQLRCNGVEVVLTLSGRLSGTIALVLSDIAARQVIASLVGEAPRTAVFSEMACSALEETGNVIASAFLVALEGLCGSGGTPGLPDLRRDSSDLDNSDQGPGAVLYGLPVNLVGDQGDGTIAQAGIFIALKP